MAEGDSALVRLLRPDLSLEQALLPALVWTACIGFVAAPSPDARMAWIALGIVAVCAAVRNTVLLGVVMAVSAFAFRWMRDGIVFGDQHWVQWFSISMAMAGRNPFEATEYNKLSWAAYLPAGNWYGGLLIACGVHAYWQVWNAICVAAWAVPLAAFRSFAALAAFAALAHWQPLLNYTSAGGNLEVAAMALFVTIWLMRCGQWTAAAVTAAFAVMIRQTGALAAPFLLLAFWRAGKRGHAFAMASLCLAGGGFFLILNPAAVAEGIRFHLSMSADKWLTTAGSLHSAFSIAGLLHGLGVDPDFILRALRSWYLPATAAACLGLFAAAWRSDSWEHAARFGLVAQFAAYFLGRYGLAEYLPSAAAPFVAFLLPAARWPSSAAAARVITGGLLAAFLTVMLAPVALWAIAKARTPVHGPVVAISEAFELGPTGQRGRELDLVNRVPGRDIRMDTVAEIRLASPESPRAMRLVGPTCVQHEDRGVTHWVTPARLEFTPSELELWRSEDGVRFELAAAWRIGPTLNAYPVTLAIPSGPPARVFRLACRRAFHNSDVWSVSNVELIR